MRRAPWIIALFLVALAAGCADPVTRRLVGRQEAMAERLAALETAVAALQAEMEGRVPAHLARQLRETGAALAAEREELAGDLDRADRALAEQAAAAAALGREAAARPRPLTRDELARRTREALAATRRRQPQPQMERTIRLIVDDVHEGLPLTPEQERAFAELVERQIAAARDNPPAPGTPPRELVRLQRRLRQEIQAEAERILTPLQRRQREWSERLLEMTEDYLDEADDAADFNGRQYDQVDNYLEAEVPRLLAIARRQVEERARQPGQDPAAAEPDWPQLRQQMTANANEFLRRILSPGQWREFQAEIGPPLPEIQPQDLPDPGAK